MQLGLELDFDQPPATIIDPASNSAATTESESLQVIACGPHGVRARDRAKLRLDTTDLCRLRRSRCQRCTSVLEKPHDRPCADFLYKVQDGPTSGPYAPRPGRGHRPLRWRSATGSSLRGRRWRASQERDCVPRGSRTSLRRDSLVPGPGRPIHRRPGKPSRPAGTAANVGRTARARKGVAATPAGPLPGGWSTADGPSPNSGVTRESLARNR